MKLTGLHILLTYQCTFECDHCFVWGSPRQGGVLTIAQIRQILGQARQAGVEMIYFEGGEPSMYYATLLAGVREAKRIGFRVGVVSNGYWATSTEDAVEFLRPFAGLLDDLSISNDLYHYSDEQINIAKNAVAAAKELDIPVGEICVAQPESADAASSKGQLPESGSAVMFRGRAVCKLAPRAAPRTWDLFTSCPHEDLRDPGRAHLDPLGNLHICQGISLGNVFATPLAEICEKYDADAHPVCGPLLAGGPAALVTEYALPHEEKYADACHLCYAARLALRERFPEILKPGQMYGEGLQE
ncbi:MAG: radical SAM protein [Anaerolineaceae bacterium]|nr:MAG: radical SAM protein [Anaerolineaceae bacterium]